jgi:hypothetical protein
VSVGLDTVPGESLHSKQCLRGDVSFFQFQSISPLSVWLPMSAFCHS